MTNFRLLLLTTVMCLSSCSSWVVIPFENRHNNYPELELSQADQDKDRNLFLELRKLKNEYEFRYLKVHIYAAKVLIVGTVPLGKISKYRQFISQVKMHNPRYVIESIELSNTPDKTKSWSSLKAKFALKNIPNNLAKRIKFVYFNGELYVFGNILPQEEVAIKLATGQLLEVKKLIMLADIYQTPDRLTSRY